MRALKSIFFLGFPLGFSLIFSGCFGSVTDNLIDGQFRDAASKPIVEAYFEYPGPHAKWVGPIHLMIHVIARGTEPVKLILTPPISGVPPKSGHALGNKSGSTESKDSSKALTAETVREELSRLRVAIQERSAPEVTCLSPVRVKLIALDGTLTEHQGCRGQTGWPRIASEIAGRFIAASLASK